MTDTSLDYLLKKAYEDGYQKGLYDGIVEAAQNSKAAASQKRIVAVGRGDKQQHEFTAVDPLVYDANLFDFLQSRQSVEAQ